MTTDPDPVDPNDLNKKVLAIPDQARSVTIIGPESYQHAADFLLTVKALLKEVDNTFNPIIDKQYQAHREALAQKKRHQDPLLLAESIIKPKMVAYRDEQERIARDAQRKAQEEATLQEAADAEADGQHHRVNEILDGKGIVAAPMPAPVAKVAGIAPRETWSAEVTDLMALLKAVVAGQAPLACVMANQPALNKQAAALKATMNYPGVKPICTKTIAAGARV